MAKTPKIYTRTGDSGTTSLVGGKRTNKSAPRVQAYGELDELNAFIGAAIEAAEDSETQDLTEKLLAIQTALFNIGALVASPPEKSSNRIKGVSNQDISKLEAWIDDLSKGLPPLQAFVLPGGSKLNSALHICRTVCRRAERSLVGLSEKEELSEQVLQ